MCIRDRASCLLDIHGQHEHQSLLYQDKQLEILDIYGKEEIFPAKDQVQKSYKEYRDCKRQLDELDIDEEQRNRERAFLEFEINEIESAQLVSGEDEELEKRYRKLNNGRKILEKLQGCLLYTSVNSSSKVSTRLHRKVPFRFSRSLIPVWKRSSSVLSVYFSLMS